MIQPERLRTLRNGAAEGDFVLYWMQSSQRAFGNHALEHAIREANARDLPIRAVFGLTSRYPEATERHYAFMREGLQDAAHGLAQRGVAFEIREGHPPEVALEAARGAALLVTDAGYLRHLREWRAAVAERARCPVVQVESDVVVPVETASPKAEIGARTLRPRLHRHLARFLAPLRDEPVRRRSQGPDGSPGGGQTLARRRLQDFLGARLGRYAANRNHPHTDDVSSLAMHLHFGHISPVEVALAAEETGESENLDSFLEELIVRRELGFNFVWHTPGYDTYEGAAPGWAQRSLEEHRLDPREHVYTPEQLEAAQTHDPSWNAAMLEMVHTGYMHNYMRMYWGKKILEWTLDPAEAYRLTLEFNNRYFLDGRDPASYAGVGWIFGLHDRAWPSRPIFGKVRSMMASGLKRKSDPEAYIRKVERLTGVRVRRG